MSLKTQLQISIVTLVTLFVFAECLLSLRIAAEANFKDAIERAQAISVQVRHLVVLRLNERAATAKPAPKTADENRELWRRLVLEDRALPELLQKTLSGSLAVVEILICDSGGVVLASNLERDPRIVPALPDFNEWTRRPVYERLLEVVFQGGGQSPDYVNVVPLGAPGEQTPVLTIRAIVSSVLIRDAIMPQVKQMLAVSGLSMLASVLLSYLFSKVILRKLDRLSRRIEEITTGVEERPKGIEGPKGDREVKEFADIQSKLDTLSQRFRGARDDASQLKANIEQMLERLEEAVLLFDPRHRLQRASRTAERMLGMSREAMASSALNDLFPLSTPLGATIRQALVTGQSVRDVTLMLDRAGADPVRVLANVELLEGSVLLTLRDAETRRQIRSQLDISTRLAAISRLTSGVAHEIKNPLNAMALHLEILRSKLEREEAVDNEVNVIGGEIARLDRVVKTFLDFTRPVELNWEDVDLAELAHQVAGLVRPEASRVGISIRVMAQTRALVRGDADLLKQATLNVVNNAIEAMANGGKLELGVAHEGGNAVLRVSDQGPGIPPAIRDKIFNLYFTTKHRGSGIGLAMTFRIVQLHNGAIELDSEPGRGTTFRMRFPEPEPASTPASHPAPVEGAA